MYKYFPQETLFARLVSTQNKLRQNQANTLVRSFLHISRAVFIDGVTRKTDRMLLAPERMRHISVKMARVGVGIGAGVGANHHEQTNFKPRPLWAV